MWCKYCGSEVADSPPFCPVCGFTLTTARRGKPPSARGARVEEEGGSLGVLWYVALSLLALALLSATLGLGMLGIREGLESRRSQDRELAWQHYQRGHAHLEEGNYLLALAEFEEAVRLAPDHDEARQQLALVQALVEDRPMPTSVALAEALDVLYEEARSLCADARREEAIIKLEQLRRLDLNYRRKEVEQMLFDAYCEEAKALTEAGELERAVAQTESALELRPDDSSASELHLSLSLYLAGLTQWGADWDRAVETFRQLYALNPAFLDARQRLHDAYIGLGDVYYAQEAWCVAEGRYGSALQIMITPAAQAKQDQSRRLCVEAISSATPSSVPTAVPTPTVTAIPSPP